MINTKRLTDRFLRYVACDSESQDEARFCTLIERELKELGLQVSRDRAGELCGSNGWNVYASLPGQGEPLLLCAHMDTVSPGKGISPVVVEGGVTIRSQGETILGADDKCGVSAILEAIQTLQEERLPHRPVEVLFTICEEIGLLGSRYADYSRLHSSQALVLDSGRVEEIINGAPSIVGLHVEVLGKSSHAAVEPELGIHALNAAAAVVAQISCGRIDEDTVVNTANFMSPGRMNIIPDRASFDIGIRSFKEEKLQAKVKEVEQILQDICGQTGARYTLEENQGHGALYVPEDTPLIMKLKKCCRRLGMEAQTTQIFGGSDASWLFSNGIDAVNIGAGMHKVHSTEEFLSVKELELAAQLLLEMLQP